MNYEFKITIDNYSDFIINNNLIVIDNEFIEKNNIRNDSIILIENIHNKNISVRIKNLSLIELTIEINSSDLYGIYCENSRIKELKLLSLEISQYKDEKFKLFQTIIDSSVIESIYVHSSKFYNGFLLRNKSIIKNISINDTIIDYSLTYTNTKSEIITIESSFLSSLFFHKSDIRNEGILSSVNKIHIFRTEIKQSFQIYETDISEIQLYKTNILKGEGLYDHNNNIFLHFDSNLKKEKKTIDKIEIRECNFDKPFVLSLDDINDFYSFESSYTSFVINFWKIISFNFINNTIHEDIFWGHQNRIKSISKFVFNEIQVSGSFYLSDVIFKEILFIKGSSFKTYPSFFNNNIISSDCKNDFEYTNLSNFVFQNIDLQNIDFKNIDILNAEFKNCNWNFVSKPFFERLKVKNEDTDNDIEELVNTKNIYSKLKFNFQKKTIISTRVNFIYLSKK